MHADQAEVEAVCGDRVHAHGGIAEQGAAVADHASCVGAHQRIGVAAADQLHGAQAAVEALFHFAGEDRFVEFLQAFYFARRQGQHHRRLPAV